MDTAIDMDLAMASPTARRWYVRVVDDDTADREWAANYVTYNDARVTPALPLPNGPRVSRFHPVHFFAAHGNYGQARNCRTSMISPRVRASEGSRGSPWAALPI